MSLHRLPPPVLLIASFAAAILLGAILLVLPLSARGEPLAPLEALFTATSAVCVTGLTVVDTGTRLSGFGQGVVLVLVQAGGLGIMTFAVFTALLLGRQITFRDRLVIQDSLHHSPTAELKKLVRYILGFTLLLEATGAALLAARFAREMPLGRAVYAGVFHAVSAFCNAGFALFPDSLTRYRADPAVNLVVSVLVVSGGLGFLVNMELRDRLLARVRGRTMGSLSLHSRLTLAVTGALLVVGFLGILALEWGNLLAGLSLGDRVLAAWFQGMTPRTAGFNTLDYGRATSATLLLTSMLMFVGASPGSTGGGIKTTSLGLIAVLLVARWRGQGRAFAFNRTVPTAVMDRALTLTALAAILLSVAVLGLVVLEQGSRPFDAAMVRFLPILFEAVSAFGTVGLSTGITAGLTPGGKVVLIGLMFLGRVGPLTVALAAGRRRRPGHFRYAEEPVMVG